jgi:hypothetical protein
MLTRSFAITVVILILLLVALQAQAPKLSTQPSSSGRYQLISSPFSIWMPDGRTTSETTVFKFDSATGRTWKCENGKVDEKIVNRWNEIQN